MDISHQIRNLSLVRKHIIFILLKIIKEHGPLRNDQTSKQKLQHDINIDREKVFDIARSRSKHLIDTDSTCKYEHPNAVAQRQNTFKDILVRMKVPYLDQRPHENQAAKARNYDTIVHLEDVVQPIFGLFCTYFDRLE